MLSALGNTVSDPTGGILHGIGSTLACGLASTCFSRLFGDTTADVNT
mgnify:CR=1 FL=1